MHREMIYTAVIYAVLALLAWLSLAGILLAIGWLGVGLWMVLKTRPAYPLDPRLTPAAH